MKASPTIGGCSSPPVSKLDAEASPTAADARVIIFQSLRSYSSWQGSLLNRPELRPQKTRLFPRLARAIFMSLLMQSSDMRRPGLLLRSGRENSGRMIDAI